MGTMHAVKTRKNDSAQNSLPNPHPSLLLLVYPRQTQPQAQDDPQQRQYNRLQHLHTLRLGNRTYSEREDGSPAAPKSSRKANGADVQVPGQKLGGSDDSSGEEGSEEEALKGDGNGRDVELGDQPED